MAKYFWLKLERQYFKRHDIQLLRSENRGYVELYIELMCESIDHEGRLRYSEAKPYTNTQLATLCQCDPATFKKAMKYFVEHELVNVDSDGTIEVLHVTERVGSRSESADRVAKHRENRRDDALHVTNSNVTSYSVSGSSSLHPLPKEIDEVLVAYRKAIEVVLPTTAWPDPGGQHRALKEMAEKTRTLAPDSGIPDARDFARAIVAAFVAAKRDGKSDYWRKASPEPKTMLRRFGELVTALSDAHAGSARDRHDMEVMEEMERIRKEVHGASH